MTAISLGLGATSPAVLSPRRQGPTPPPLPLRYKWTIDSANFVPWTINDGSAPAGDDGTSITNAGYFTFALNGETWEVVDFCLETSYSAVSLINGATYDDEGGGGAFSNDSYVNSASFVKWGGNYWLDLFWVGSAVLAAMEAGDDAAVVPLEPFTDLGGGAYGGSVESDYTANNALRYLGVGVAGTITLAVLTPTLRYRWTLATVSGNCFGLVGAPGDTPSGDDGGGIAGTPTCYFDLEDDGFGGYNVVNYNIGTTASNPGPQFPAVDYNVGAGGTAYSNDDPACNESVQFQDATANSIFSLYWAPGSLFAAMTAGVDGTLVPLLSYPDGTAGNTAEYDTTLDLNRYLNSGSTLELTVLYIYP